MAYFIVNKNVRSNGTWWAFNAWWESLDEALANVPQWLSDEKFYIYIPYYMNDGTPSIWCDTSDTFRDADTRLPGVYTLPQALEIVRLYAPLL